MGRRCSRGQCTYGCWYGQFVRSCFPKFSDACNQRCQLASLPDVRLPDSQSDRGLYRGGKHSIVGLTMHMAKSVMSLLPFTCASVSPASDSTFFIVADYHPLKIHGIFFVTR